VIRENVPAGWVIHEKKEPGRSTRLSDSLGDRLQVLVSELSPSKTEEADKAATEKQER
jgi:hypothetical protein